MKREYERRKYIALIFEYNNKYLCFKISRNYKICPDQWEWFTIGFSTLQKKGIILESVGKLNREHLQRIAFQILERFDELKDISKEDIKSMHPSTEEFVWDDDEFSLTYEIFPVVISLKRKITPSLPTGGKFSEVKWFELQELQSLNNDYLRDFLKFLSDNEISNVY